VRREHGDEAALYAASRADQILDQGDTCRHCELAPDHGLVEELRRGGRTGEKVN
jgi:hypothetical protein